MSEQLIITTGKLLKKKISVEYFKGLQKAECKEDNKLSPHPDLVAAFKALSPHAAFISEFIDTADLTVKGKKAETKEISFKNEADHEEFITTGFTITEKEGIMLFAYKVLSTGSTLQFNAPTVKGDTEAGPGYVYFDDLENKLKVCKAELELYLGGKIKPEEVVKDNQVKMEFPGDGIPPDSPTPDPFFQSPEQAARVMDES